MAEAPVAPPLTEWSLLRRTLRRHRGRLTGSYALLSLWHVCEALVPVAIGIIIDTAIAPGDLSAFVVGAVGLSVLMGVLSYSYRFGARLGFEAVQREQHALRLEITEHVLHPRGARTGLLPGELLSVATSDTDAVTYVVRQLGFTLSALASVVGAAAYLLWLDVWLGVLVLVGVPTVVALTQVISPVIARRSSAEQAAVARAAGMATDLVQGVRPLAGVGAERIAVSRYRDASGRAATAAVRTVRGWGVLAGTTSGLSGLLLAAVALVAGLRALDGDLTLGQFVAVAGLTQFLAEPVGMLAEIGAHAATSRASAARVGAVLRTPRLVPDGDATPTGPLSVSFEGVVTGPLTGLDLIADPGQLVAVVVDDPGSSDTLVALLSGEAVPEGGEARIGGVPLHSLSVEARREALLVANHHVDLFEGSVRFNVDPTAAAPDDRLGAALDASAASEVVHSHPDGLDRRVRVSGALSGGQRQRLALARALTADRPVLVLQDPTSAVDSVTEEVIAAGLRGLRHGEGSSATTLVITSSPSVLQQADRVFLVLDGKTVADGTHAELLGRADYDEAVLR
ncbi:ABC transporter ATP-binding protein [Mumia zhuanghuii]|uniref:ABC transporter ATP-binding protein n=2 Tax=Mumia TaxID=1546255 RepID=A0ABW1QGY6_9ACTN|nr:MULTISPECIES: ABC transporter ATP-binding protein [Mumia]KAA1425266.1 ABC transporter ATP-binding protein [Mumia zhuanghuii]